jgi:serine/threonine protein kinase
MKTRLMIIEQALPLTHTSVRVTGTGIALRTDDAGQLELDLASGAHQLEIGEGEELRRVPLQLGVTPPPLMVIDLARLAETQPAQPSNTQRLAALLDDRQRLQDRIDASNGRYRIDAILGRGGMGVVLKAWDKVLERTVAIKTLSDELQENPEAQRLFIAEARSLAKLSHPNLVAVHDVTMAQDVALMVFEFVEGATLDAVIREEPLTEEIGLSVAIQAAQALAYLHEQGIIHRDIKPSNLMWTASGDLKLIDFGLARSLDDIMARGTRVRGTPAYMAPEQIMGTELGPGVDVYQLGVTYFECFTGRVPFEEGNLFVAHVSEPAPSIASLHPTLHPALIQIIDRCLAKGPESRFVDAGALLGALLQIKLSQRSPLTPSMLLAHANKTAPLPARLAQRTAEHANPTAHGTPNLVTDDQRARTFQPAQPTYTSELPNPAKISASRVSATIKQPASKRLVAGIFAATLLAAGVIVAILIATRPDKQPSQPPVNAPIIAAKIEPAPVVTPPEPTPAVIPEPAPVELAIDPALALAASGGALHAAWYGAEEATRAASGPDTPKRPTKGAPRPVGLDGPILPVNTDVSDISDPKPIDPPKPDPVEPKPVEPARIAAQDKPNPEAEPKPKTLPPKVAPDPIDPPKLTKPIKKKKPVEPPRVF